MKANILALLLAALFLAGCNTNLVVSTPGDTALSPKKGIPFSLPKPHVAIATYTKLKSGKRCNPITFTKFVSLPTGALYHVNTRPQLFAKSEFTIELNEHGILKKIVFNADPELSETIASTAGLVTAISGDQAPSQAVPSGGGSGKSALTGEPDPSQLEAAQKFLKDSEAVQELQRHKEAMETIRKILDKAKELPSCDTGERITCVQPLVPGQEIEEC